MFKNKSYLWIESTWKKHFLKSLQIFATDLLLFQIISWFLKPWLSNVQKQKLRLDKKYLKKVLLKSVATFRNLFKKCLYMWHCFLFESFFFEEGEKIVQNL